jgi:biopolymer transport protein ExbD
MRKRLYRPSFAVQNGPPISDINTTPLIDVMLVLLIMFIITIPITTHKVPIDLPQGGPSRAEPVVHRLDLDAAGRLAWNGSPLAPTELGPRLVAVKADPAAELHFRTDAEVRYERFDEVLAQIKGAGITRLGLIDNQRFARFDR